jgi:hypothetical protein
MAAEDDKLETFRNGLSMSARRGSCFVWRQLRKTTSVGPVGKSPLSLRTRRTRSGRLVVHDGERTEGTANKRPDPRKAETLRSKS